MLNAITRGTRTLLLAAACLGVAAPAQQTKLTLDRAVAIALEKNPVQKLAMADTASADAGLRQARVPLFPQIGFAETITRGNDPVYAFGTKLRQQRFQSPDFALNNLNRPTPINNFTTGFTGRWTAFDSLHTQLQMKRASLLKQSAASSASRTGQEVIYRVVSAYEAALIAAREIEVASRAVETAQALLGLSRNRVEAGVAVESDVLSAQVNLAARQQDLIQAQGTQAAAWSELGAAMGVTLPPGHETVESLGEHGFATAPLSDEVAEALKSRPDLKSLASQVSAQHAAVQSTKSEFGPRVDAFGTWQTDRPSIAGAGGNNWVAGAEIRLDLLPLEKRARLRQEKAGFERAQAAQELAENTIRVEVSRAYYEHQSAAQMVEVARSIRAQAAESLRILRNRYEAGLATLTDVLRAEDAERQSQTGYWRAVYSNSQSYAALRLATGTLTPDQVVNFQ